MAATEEEKLDVVEVSDEIVRTSRYGRRNYRNSIGVDHRRHWHGEFLVDEEEIEAEEEQAVDPETFDQLKSDQEPGDETSEAESTVEDPDTGADDGTDAEESAEEDSEDVEAASETEEAEETKEEDQGNMVDVSYGDFDDETPEHTEEEVENFFDPLQNVEGLEDVVTESEQTVEVTDGADDAEEERTDAVSEGN